MRYSIQTKLMIGFSLAAFLLGITGQIWYSFAQKLHEEQLNTSEYTSGMMEALAITVGCFTLILGIGMALSRMLSRPISQIALTIEEVAAGQLNGPEITLGSRDELEDTAKSINTMTSNLRVLIRRVSDSSHQVSLAADRLNETAEQNSLTAQQIEKVIQNVTLGSEQQVKEVSYTNSSVNQMNTGLEHIANYAVTVDTSSIKAAKEATAGNLVISKSMEQMKSIASAFGHTAETIQRLGECSEEIVNFALTIRGIADTTNLLALNASIEAAHAGDFGRGFSVIAIEVKQLADASKRAADQISLLLNDIKKEILQAVTTMQDSSLEVSSGITIISDAGSAFMKITNAIDQVTVHSKQVRDITQDAFSHANHISLAVKQLETIAKQSYTSSGEAAAATLEQAHTTSQLFHETAALQKMSQELQDLIRRFDV
ncbi:methyl-accepting chemotaxis protein [Paenibacillus sp. G2S3]|uniref:methyl-accepting chemotaxis protein n=1 Tax=Paenibacillus sp. G2S3 TaxID=3047872 RepID=UPI0024C0F59D|nr:methyl-accepting chemotaxis protein [Paenibacillus sp. G2S3]WHY21759.1 methyl-accepting chemotaxis protein [Paenibacillus sp. G2S3]